MTNDNKPGAKKRNPGFVSGFLSNTAQLPFHDSRLNGGRPNGVRGDVPEQAVSTVEAASGPDSCFRAAGLVDSLAQPRAEFAARGIASTPNDTTRRMEGL